MSAYGCFSEYYDELMSNVEYDRIAEYYNELIKEKNNSAVTLLDMAGGTGSMSVLFADMGYDVICADASPDMLAIGREKAEKENLEKKIFFICQYMQELELYEPVDCVVCALDSINHLESEDDVWETFKRVYKNLNSGGVFVFDVNTPYKHKEILADNTFVIENKDVFCVWQNYYIEEEAATDICLDFFINDGKGKYERYSEEFTERAYEPEILEKMLQRAGFSVEGIYDEYEKRAPSEGAQRVVFVAVKK